MSSKIERIPTGIELLDKYLQGGIPKHSWVFIAGEPGTGKSILCLHTANTALSKNICPVVYVTTEQNFQSLVKQAEQFNMHFNGFKDKGTLHIVDIFELRSHAYEKKSKAKYPDPLDVGNLVDYLWSLVREKRIREPLIIIDSLSAFWVDKPAMARRITYNMKVRLAKMQPTVIATLQYAVTTGGSFGFGAEHIADGIIQLNFDNIEKTKQIKRWGIIKKMRLTNHYKRAWSFDIKPKQGFVILNESN
ncbi:MAG: KaiC domain-containing protein [Thermoprotei archaeon]|nr:MAG: KaiC domain-containing protein [Thermoprotei archaeon]